MSWQDGPYSVLFRSAERLMELARQCGVPHDASAVAPDHQVIDIQWTQQRNVLVVAFDDCFFVYQDHCLRAEIPYTPDPDVAPTRCLATVRRLLRGEPVLVPAY